MLLKRGNTMFNLIRLQFRYSASKWLGTLFVFSAAGSIIGFSLIGVDSTMTAHFDKGLNNPIIFFTLPTMFGVLTLILIINGITRLLIDNFKTEYTLWTTLGANPNQLSLLISGQMTITSLIGAIIGYFLAYPIVVSAYSWIRTTPGMSIFPRMQFQFSIQSFTLTLLAVGVISAVMSFIDARRIFQKSAVSSQKSRNNSRFWLTNIWRCINVSGLIYLYSLFYRNPSIVRQLFAEDNHDSLANNYTQLFIGITILTSVTFSLVAPILLPSVVQLISKIVPSRLMRTAKTAYWQVIGKKTYLSSLVVPLFMLSLLTSFFTYLAFDLANIAAKRSLSEIIGTLALFLGGPLLIIIANIISITIITSEQRNASLQQLQILGFTFKNLIAEKCVEALFYGGVISITGILNNAFLFGAILKAARNTNITVNDSWLSISYWPLLAGIVAFIFVITIDLSHIYRISIKPA